jgi:predicted nicotinamide N-methyase
MVAAMTASAATPGPFPAPPPPQAPDPAPDPAADPAQSGRLRAFIAGATAVSAPPLTPGLRMHLAAEITPIWTMTEDALARQGLPPPFWAFAWPGGQAMARLLLDRPDLVRDRRVLALGCGGGLEAMAALRAGAAHAAANDLDPVALLAAAMNAELNGLALDTLPGDLTAAPPPPGFDVILAADVFYEHGPARRLLAWLRRAAAGATVLAADAGRGFLPTDGLIAEAVHEAPTLRPLEDRDSRTVTIWRVPPL